jgi:hypothetical protein
MARYVTTQPTGWGPDTAFGWMVDLRNLAEWDPSIVSSEQVSGVEPGVGAEYVVELKAAGSVRSMRYRIEEMDAEARTLLARSETPVLTSYDRISVEAQRAGGATVTYDADLVLKGPLKLGDPLLSVAFGRVGDKAAEGLGAKLSEPPPR